MNVYINEIERISTSSVSWFRKNKIALFFKKFKLELRKCYNDVKCYARAIISNLSSSNYDKYVCIWMIEMYASSSRLNLGKRWLLTPPWYDFVIVMDTASHVIAVGTATIIWLQWPMIMWLQCVRPWSCGCSGYGHGYVVAMGTAMTMWLQGSWLCGCNGYGHDYVAAVGTTMIMWLRWVRPWPCGCSGYGHEYVVAVDTVMITYVIARLMIMWLQWVRPWLCGCDGHGHENVIAMTYGYMMLLFKW